MKKESCLMELEWKTCTVAMPEVLSPCVTETSFDLDMQLPDYMPDIHRILHCAVTPQILSVAASGNRAAVEGSGIVRLLYGSEDGQICAYEQTFPIRRASPEDVPVGNTRVSASVEYVNCRASGQRRAAVNGSVSLRFTPVCMRESVIPTQSAAEGLQTKTKQLSVCSMTACTEKLFAMSEVVELADDPPVGSILYTRTYLRTDTTRAVQDKILVKGEAVTEVRYMPASDTASVTTYRHTMPVNQVIEAVGVSENDVIDVTLCAVSSLVVPKADGSGDNRLLDIALQVSASVRCFMPMTPEIITDAYSTTANLLPKYTEADMITDCFRWQESVAVREKTDISGADIQTLQMVCADAVQVDCSVTDGYLTANCTAELELLGQNGDGLSVWTKKTVTFVCRKQLHDTPCAATCTPTVCLTQCGASLSPDGTLDVQADGFIDGMVYLSEPVRLLLSADAEPIPDTQSPAALTIYFAEAGEPVWDIARKYRTTTQAVTAENDLTGDTIPQKQMLVIPLG